MLVLFGRFHDPLPFGLLQELQVAIAAGSREDRHGKIAWDGSDYLPACSLTSGESELGQPQNTAPAALLKSAAERRLRSPSSSPRRPACHHRDGCPCHCD